MEIVLISIAVACLGAVSLASRIRRSRQRAFLTKTLEVDDSLRERVARELGVDGALVTGVSAFDVLYNTMKLDPNALKGMDHLHRAQDFDNLGDLMDFMKSDIIKSEPGDAVWESMINKYKGYTGEQIVAEHFREAGHNVEMPESGTAEGWDLRVDGKPYNVKITDNPSYIQAHLNEHPDIDVITNREMADAFRDNPRVVIDSKLASQGVFDDTTDTFEAMTDLGDGLDSIPFISLVFNTVKNVRKMSKGDLDSGTAVEHTVLDTAASGLGGWLGGTAGLGWGMALAPVTGGLSAIVLPILGGLAGIFTGKGISGWFKERHLRKEIKELQDLAAEFRDAFLDLYGTVVGAIDSFFEPRLAVAANRVSDEGFFKRIVFPSAKTTFYRMASKELEAERTDCHSFYEELRQAVQDAEEPSEGGLILFTNCQQQGMDMLRDVEPLPEYYDAIEAQLEIIEKEERKLR